MAVLDSIYSPLVLRIVAPVRLAGAPTNTNRPLCTVEIKAPDSALPAVHQTIAETQRIVVPQDGWLRLQLIPTDCYVPKGRYRVRYFFQQNRLPFLEQYWQVPRFHCMEEVTITRSDQDYDEVPDVVFRMDTVSVDGQWNLVMNRLYWLNQAPPVGTVYRIRYARGLTLDQVVDRRVDTLGYARGL